MCDHGEKETFWIPKHHETTLKAQVAKLNKKAKKLNCPELSYKVLGEKLVIAKGFEQKAEIWGASECPHVPYIEVQLIGEGPKIEGWKFLGTLDHITLPGSVIVNTVPGEEIPQQFHNSEPVCDHCGKHRRRNETFILQKEDSGEYKRIGRQCVRDFIGYDPSSILRYIRALDSFVEDFDNEERWGFGGGQQAYVFDHDDVLRVTAALIDKYGWVPRSAVDDEHRSTASDVIQYYFPPNRTAEHAYRMWVEWRKSLNPEDPRWVEDAKNAREWLKQQPSNNEYLHNLHAIDNAEGGVPVRLFGYWCSVVAGYQRAMEKLRLAERDKKVNEYVGEVKERREFVAKLKRRQSFDGAYGTVRLHVFLDEDGHTLVWWANTDPELSLDETYRFKGTVKKHEERDGWKQTIITRVKVEECIEKEAA
jgi:hypothetical protein